MGIGFSSSSEYHNIYEGLDEKYQGYPIDNVSNDPYMLRYIKNIFKPILDDVMDAKYNSNNLCEKFYSKIDKILSNYGNISNRSYDIVYDIIYILYIRLFLIKAKIKLNSQDDDIINPYILNSKKKKIIEGYYNDETFNDIASETDYLIRLNKNDKEGYHYLNGILEDLDITNHNDGLGLNCGNVTTHYHEVLNNKIGGNNNNVLLLLIISIIILLLCYLLYLIYNKLYYCKFYNNKINMLNIE
jgi:hypothetical protein